MKKIIILIIVTLILSLTPIYVDASSNPGNYDPGVGHELCPDWKNCHHNGW